MITTVGAIIVNNLSQEIRDSKYFSILSDEAADISNKENLSVVIRFLDSMKTVREEFVGFYLCEDGTTGAAIKDLIIGAVADLGLSAMDNCRGHDLSHPCGQYVWVLECRELHHLLGLNMTRLSTFTV